MMATRTVAMATSMVTFTIFSNIPVACQDGKGL